MVHNRFHCLVHLPVELIDLGVVCVSSPGGLPVGWLDRPSHTCACRSQQPAHGHLASVVALCVQRLWQYNRLQTTQPDASFPASAALQLVPDSGASPPNLYRGDRSTVCGAVDGSTASISANPRTAAHVAARPCSVSIFWVRARLVGARLPAADMHGRMLFVRMRARCRIATMVVDACCADLSTALWRTAVPCTSIRAFAAPDGATMSRVC